MSSSSGPSTPVDNPPLWSAAASGRTGEVKRLLKDGASANITNRAGTTALMTAARGGHLEIMRLLIDAGAVIDHRNEIEDCALFEAMAWRNLEAVKLLTEAGANVNIADKVGFSALMRAAYKADREIIRHLVAKGADIHAKNSNGETALDIYKSASAAWHAANPEFQDEILGLLGEGGKEDPASKYGKNRTEEKIKLEAVPIPGEWTENVAICFVGIDSRSDSAEFRIEVARATAGMDMNTPYAADDSYSFTATLSELNGGLLVSITQTKSTAGALSNSENRFLLSSDGGRSWKNISADELKLFSQGLPPKLLSRVSG